MSFRHACKQFDLAMNIPKDDFKKILEFGCLSPSSFGMEPWRFLVIEKTVLRKQLQQACWGQPQITDSSYVVVILAKTATVKPGADYVNQLFVRRQLADDALQMYIT